MGRNYLVFGSDDGVYWELLNTIEASGAPQALNKARGKESHKRYAAVPERNWAEGEPEVVERPPVVRWKMKGDPGSEQMTVDEVLSESEQEGAIEEAKEAVREALGMDEKEKEEVV